MMESQSSLKIELVDYGIANHFEKHIEINRELLAYPDLYDYVLAHERSHVSGSYGVADFKNDFKINFKMIFRLILFSIVRPKTWVDFLPIYKRKGQWIYDKGMALSYGIIIFLMLILAAMVFVF